MPGYGNYVLSKGYDAESAIAKYTAVKVGAGDEAVTACTAQGETGVGVVQFAVTTDELAKGKGASVVIEGIVPWVASTSITRGQLVTTGTAGKCEPAGSGDYVWGEALQDGENGDQIAVLLTGVKTVL